MASLTNVLSLNDEKIEELKREMGVPQGIAEGLIEASNQSIRRYWIVDNSGSMSTQDGKKIVNNQHLLQCSRWQELGDSLKWHGQVACILGAHTEFRMLNKPRNLRQQNVIIGAEGSDNQTCLAQLNNVLKSSPAKQTPLCTALRQVIVDITALAPGLRATGKSVSVIIASDGQATDGDIDTVKETLRPLIDLPCDVIVRLCTGESEVVEYWNTIDQDLHDQLKIDVLDDTVGEGTEVHLYNDWIAYGEPLQRFREFGCAPQVFDYLHERCLRTSEVMQVIKYILGESIVTYFPRLELDVTGYIECLEQALLQIEPVFDASRGKDVSWVDVTALLRNIRTDAGAP